jgi:hypothetical protein
MCRRVRGQEAFRKGMMRKPKKKGGRRLLTVLLFVLLTTAASLVGIITAVQGAGVNEVTRYAPEVLAPDSEFEVKLTITGELPLIVGIVETIPEGFGFVSTTSDHCEISGQEVAFAVIDETEITYWVKAPSSGEGSFTGTWIDMLSDSEGCIADTIVIVGGGGTGAIGVETPTSTPAVTTTTSVTTPKPSPTATATATATATPAAIPASEMPGFEAIFTAVSLLIACLFVVMWRTKGEGGTVK